MFDQTQTQTLGVNKSLEEKSSKVMDCSSFHLLVERNFTS